MGTIDGEVRGIQTGGSVGDAAAKLDQSQRVVNVRSILVCHQLGPLDKQTGLTSLCVVVADAKREGEGRPRKRGRGGEERERRGEERGEKRRERGEKRGRDKREEGE